MPVLGGLHREFHLVAPGHHVMRGVGDGNEDRFGHAREFGLHLVFFHRFERNGDGHRIVAFQLEPGNRDTYKLVAERLAFGCMLGAPIHGRAHRIDAHGRKGERRTAAHDLLVEHERRLDETHADTHALERGLVVRTVGTIAVAGHDRHRGVLQFLFRLCDGKLHEQFELAVLFPSFFDFHSSSPA